MKCFFYALIFLFAAFFETNAQSVAINTSGATANASAILDISSNSKGVLVPRMTKAQKNAIAAPAIGLLVYQALPDSIGFHYYNGTAWVWLSPSSGGGNDWSLTGNAGTDTAVNFIGTTDNEPLRFKQNNLTVGQWNINNGTYFLGKWAGRSNTTGSHNIGIGDSALYSNTVSVGNVAIGYRALRKNTGSGNNTAIGYQSLFSNIGSDNTAIGYNALNANTNGTVNTAIGSEALVSNSTGYGNTAVGSSALFSNTTGFNNNAFGGSALSSNISGTNNLAFGGNAMLLNETGSRNVALSTASLYNNSDGNANIGIGFFSLLRNVSGNYNVAIGENAVYNSINLSRLIAVGSNALYSNSSGTALTAIGDSALYSNTTGYKNIALGNSALVKNTTGFQNTAIGYNTLKDNQSGFANIAIGDSALAANTTSWNIAIGRYALLETTTGDKNIAIGEGALTNNLTGINNVAIGYAAQVSANTNNKNNTSLGFRSAYSMQGYSNTVIGGDAMGKPATSYTVNNTVAVGDSVLFNIVTGASSNTAVGTKAMFSNTTGQTNTAIGARALHDNTAGSNNVAIGDSAAFNSTASNQVAIGSKAMWNNISGTGNTIIGYHGLFNNTIGGGNTVLGNNALLNNVSGSTNTAIGNLTGQLNTGSGNVFIGYSAGFNETGSNKLYIDNSNTTSPLLYGDFATNLLRVNGTLNINNAYSFPIADGSANQVLQTNGAGVVSWASVGGESTTANNGLTLTGNNVALGGPLVSNTTITHANFNLTHSLSGAGDFIVSTPTRPTAFTVLNTGDVGVNGNDFYVANTGNVGINSSVPSARLHVVNGVSGSANNYSSGLLIENTAGAAGQATLAFKNFVLPGNRAWITGMNTFDNFVIAYGDSLSATNVVLRVDTAGYVGINPGGAPNSRLDVTGSFGNAIRVTTVSTTLDVDDHTIIIGPAAGAVTITLPTAAGTGRREYIIVNRSSSNQAVTAYNDFSGTSVIVAANSAITLQSNGTNWFRIQ